MRISDCSSDLCSSDLLLANGQEQPEFLRLNPNGGIPVIVDPCGPNGELVLFESGAILMYLAEKTGRLLPRDPGARLLALQWLMFQMGGIGPMMGQANVFYRYLPEKIPTAIDRYRNRSEKSRGGKEGGRRGRYRGQRD